MKTKSLPCGFELPVLGMGTWGTGGRETPVPDDDDAARLVRTLRTAVDAGFTRMDTAEYYAAGFSETLLGRAIAGLPRASLFLTSKVWKTHLRHDDVIRACEASLKRLRTDYLDLYLIHQVNDDVPLEETLAALNRLADDGKIRHIGVSNFAVPRLERAIRLSPRPIVLNQIHYNLRVREAERSGMLEFCRAHDVLLEAWRPVRDVPAAPVTEALCETYRCSLAQLAIAFLLNQPNVVTLTAMRTPAHIPENIAAADLRLAPGDIEHLRRTYPDTLDRSPAVPLS